MGNNTSETVQVNLKLNGLQDFKTFKDLNGAVVAQRNALNKMKLDDPGYNEATKRLRSMVEQQVAWKNEINGANDAQKKFFRESKGGFAEILKISGGVVLGNIFTGLINGGRQFLTGMVETFLVFEKFETILTNALGDRSIAKQALQQLSDFASKTPFQLEQLADSYVKLVNRGFKPTNDELTKMGDLAASQGKEFAMLTEAILDAQTGEFERLKEFGIKASKNGDMVSLSFKGMTQEVKFADEAIRNAILGFGEMEGVAGGMEALSKDVGGQISNISDNWDRLLNTLGSKTGGWLYSATSTINEYLDWIVQASQSAEQRIANIAQRDAAKSGVRDEFSGATQARRESMKTSRIKLIDKSAEKLKNVKFDGDPNASMDERIANINEQRDYLTYLIESTKADLSIFKEVETMEATQARQKESDRQKAASIAAKQAAEEKKRQTKQDEAERKRAQDKEKKDHEQLQEDIKRNEQELFLARLTKNDAEVEKIREKYEKLRTRAKGSKDDLVAIANQEAEELIAVQKRQAEEELKIREEKKKNALKQLEDEVNKQFAEDKDDLQNDLGTELSGLTEEEDILKTKEVYLAKERDLTQEHLLILKGLYEAYGRDTGEIDTQLTALRLENIEKELEGKRLSVEAKRRLEDTFVSLTLASTDAIRSIFGKRTVIYKAALGVEAAYNVAKVTMDTQAEIKGYWKTYAGIPGGQLIAGILTALAVGRTGLAIAKITKAATMGGNDRTAKKGALIAKGPSHEDGGIDLINNKTGERIVEMEGGEPIMILSKETYGNNAKLINELLYNSQFRNGAPVNVNSNSAIGGLSQYRTGGIPGAPDITVNSQPDLSALLFKLDSLEKAIVEEKHRGVVLNYRLFEEFGARVQNIRNDVNG